MDPQRLAQIRERIRQGRAFLSDSHDLLREVDRLNIMVVQLGGFTHEPIEVGGKRPASPERHQHG